MHFTSCSPVLATHAHIPVCLLSAHTPRFSTAFYSVKCNHLPLQDELQTTTRSYEGQLSMMSEHLAGMNEKLAQQKDEIDDLRAQQAQNKSVLGKVGWTRCTVLFSPGARLSLPCLDKLLQEQCYPDLSVCAVV